MWLNSCRPLEEITVNTKEKVGKYNLERFRSSVELGNDAETGKAFAQPGKLGLAGK